MKKIIFTICALSLLSSAVRAQEYDSYESDATSSDYVDYKRDILNKTVIQPDQHAKYAIPVKLEAARMAKTLNEKEARMLISTQNKINRDIARKKGESTPEKITASPTNAEDIEKVLSPNIYTYDDEQIEL